MQRAKRKLEHIQYALELGDGPAATHLADLRFLHNCLPEINPADFVLSVEILGKRLRLPFFIDAITGSTDAVTEINRKLAQVAVYRCTADLRITHGNILVHFFRSRVRLYGFHGVFHQFFLHRISFNHSNHHQ